MSSDRRDEHVYECANCGTRFPLPDGEVPRVERHAASGKPTLRVLTVRGAEIHRCRITSSRPGAAARHPM